MPSLTCEITFGRGCGRVFDVNGGVEALLVEHDANDDQEDDARDG